jgi:predicted nucleotidyltransferase
MKTVDVRSRSFAHGRVSAALAVITVEAPMRPTAGLKCDAMTMMDLNTKRQDILRIAAAHGARNVRLFGSAARGEDRAGSDVDLLVDMEAGRSLLDLIALGQDLEDLLPRKVDVLTDQSVHPAIRPHILADARPL